MSSDCIESTFEAVRDDPAFEPLSQRDKGGLAARVFLCYGGSLSMWETTEDLAVRVVAILRHDGGPLRARDILTILEETGTRFITDNPVYSVVGALKVARENGWVVKKGRGWWQAASQVPADGGESGGRGEGGDGQWSHE